jgi:hypothetical protein
VLRQKSNLVKRDVVGRWDYRLAARRCAACHSDGAKWGQWLEIHHIIGFPGRSDEPANWLCVCHRCHVLLEGHRGRYNGVQYPPLTLGHALTFKRLEDPDNYNPERLAQLYGQALPDELPLWLGEERTAT